MKTSLPVALLFVAVLPGLLGSCGPKGRGGAEDGPSPDTGLPAAPRSGAQPGPGPKPSAPARIVNRLVEAVPVETFLVGGLRIPDRLKLRDLTVSVRSNVDGATFECRTKAGAAFTACPDGAGYSLTGMADRSSHNLEIRARAPVGEVDATPLALSFVVDMELGSLPEAAGVVTRALVPGSATELATAPSLQLGSFFAVAVPGAPASGTLVSSYATDKTYNGRLLSMRLLSLYPDPCVRGYESRTTLSTGEAYCEATPTRLQLAADYAEPLPRNHLEVVRYTLVDGVPGAKPTERFLLAAFDAEPDEAEGHMGVSDSCRGATSSGLARGTLVRNFAGELEAGGVLWCQVRDAAGEWWWVASFSYETAGGGAWVKGIYAASAKLGIVSGPDFAERAAALVRGVLVPVAAP